MRREGNGIRRYVHLGTGNDNPHTARLYTDLSLFTWRGEMADDVSALFNMLTGYAVAPRWKRLAVAPMGLPEEVLSLIHREVEKARRGEPARIVARRGWKSSCWCAACAASRPCSPWRTRPSASGC